MPYSYTKKTWTNYSGTPINATNLTDHENALHKGNAHLGTSAPSDTDREWFDTNTNPPTLKVYSGGSWVAVSAGESLKAADRTTCNAADGWATSAGWFPTARHFDADKATTYYRDPGNIRARPIPTGLKMLTHRAVFKDHLTTMHFSNCVRVDGVGRPILDSSNHESHLYDAGQRACPSSHPYRIPQVSYLIHWQRNFTENTQISIGSGQWDRAGNDMHADYFAAVQDEFNFATPAGKALIDLCLNDVPLSVDMKSPRCGEWP